MTILNPCPFCGREAILESNKLRYGTIYSVYCQKCGAEIARFSEHEAVAAWNRRAERTGRWVSVVNTWTQDEHEYGATWHKCDQCGRLCETKQPYCHCGAHMIGGDNNG